jgi:hypothetical protein
MIEELTTLSLETSTEVAIVDKNKLQELKKYKWKLSKDGYVFTMIRRKIVRLQVMVKGKWYDHKNRNKLHNYESNLRLATFTQNLNNRNKFIGNYTSKYKGVSFCRFRKKWKAQISINGKAIALGRYLSEIEAAIAYNKAAVIHHGEFAVLNAV